MFHLVLLLLLGLGLVPSEQTPVEVELPEPWRALPRFNTTTRFERHRLRFLPPPVDVQTLAGESIQELWVSQILDHYNPLDQRTWQQRYFARTDLYKEGGPVFIYIGGEGEESRSTLANGALFMSYLADQFKAKMFDLEHRYYGASKPTSDLTSANLQYLSADQALADLAFFIKYLIAKGDIEEGQKVVVFGGSYPGNLAAWARLKYPHLITAAVASSAPVFAKADFGEYYEVVANALERVAGKFCRDNLKKATDRIMELLQTTKGYTQVKSLFKVGSELKDKLDLDSFFETLSNPFAGAVQYHRESSRTYNIKEVCSYLSGDNLSGDVAMQKLAYLLLGTDYYGTQLYDWSYKSSVEVYQKTDYFRDESGTWSATRQWVYQTCTEYGYYQTFSGKDVPFPKAYNDIAYSYELCKDLYGEGFGSAVLNKAVARSNLVFGERKPDVTNVYFVNGNIDPWHALGILEDVSPRAPAYVIDVASHCADMYYPSYADSASLSEAHKRIHAFVRSALYETPFADPAHV